MVDILDMEDIFYDIILDWNLRGYKTNGRVIAKKLIEEVSNFVEAQQTIKCNSCDERSEESFDETRRIMVEDRD